MAGWGAKIASILWICLLAVLPQVLTFQMGKRNVNAKYLTPLEKDLLKRSKAADIKSWMNSSGNPCEDFYDFACGNWARINSAENLHRWSTEPQDAAEASMRKRISSYLNAPTKLGSAVDSKVHNFYDSCRRISSSSCLYSSMLKKFYEEFGQFSYLKKPGRDKLKSDFSWWATAARMHVTYGKKLLIETVVDHDLRSKGQPMLYIREPGEFTQNLQKEEQLKTIYGATAEQAQKVTQNINILEKALYEAGEEFRQAPHSPDELYTLYNMTEAQELLKGLFDLETFLRISLNTTDLPGEVYVQNNRYFENLAGILADTEPDTTEDFMLLALLDEYIPVAENDNLDNWCEQMAVNYFDSYIMHTVYNEYRSALYEIQLYDLWQDLKSVMLDDLKGSRYKWMSDITREYAIRKLNRMIFVVDSHVEQDFKEAYRQLDIDAVNFVSNTQKIKRHRQQRRGDGLQLQADGDATAQEEMKARTVSYLFRQNRVSVSVLALQPFYLWHPAYPHAIKYAILGSKVAQQMVRAFGERGRYFDAEGNVNNWWDELSIYEFAMRRRCFQTQYHNYTIGEEKLPDSSHQDANIADNAAVRIAFHAYQRWLERAKENGKDVMTEETLLNLPYSHLELFFISYGQSFCADVEESTQLFLAPEQTPHRYRVLGPLQNFAHFSNVYKCFGKCEMNPQNKCEIF